MRLKLVLAAAAMSMLPLMSGSALARDNDGWRGGDRGREVFYRDGCRVEREWRGNGRYRETVDCGDRHSGWRGHDDRGWRGYDRGRDWRDDRWRESRYDDRYVGRWFGDRHRSSLTRYYGGRDCHRYRSDWGRPYSLGREFPRGHRWSPISRELYGHFGAPPRGYVYGRYNDDVLLIQEATRLVVDAIIAGDRRDRW